jgi:hypothetical protein
MSKSQSLWNIVMSYQKRSALPLAMAASTEALSSQLK